MRGRSRIRAVCLIALAAVSVVVFTACGAGASGPASTANSPSVSPTSKATLPGPNNFSPGPVTPMNPTVNPTDGPVKKP
jgi:hypothetical protein